jgi:hypothetical protein
MQTAIGILATVIGAATAFYGYALLAAAEGPYTLGYPLLAFGALGLISGLLVIRRGL